ncbi:hypothetical protein UFOVP315_16 [uncultured Caudovirales phage]|uniref:Uncharacterized protein n=1 Tax=uncultured Caudovirales phage TaxID=2100421 RepID=A0A6J5LT69_9CAUD|nr:hypothetical protein UFOVP315_16 [uncultured Caudovirales phage]
MGLVWAALAALLREAAPHIIKAVREGILFWIGRYWQAKIEEARTAKTKQAEAEAQLEAVNHAATVEAQVDTAANNPAGPDLDRLRDHWNKQA